ADLPRQLSELIDRLLEKQPDARPAGAAEVVEVLEPMVRAISQDDGASTATPESFTEAPAPTKLAEDVQPFQLRGERRQLTLLCCQLVGGALDPEVLFEVLPPFQTVVNEAIERYEGHLRDVQGHRFVAIFGYPRSHEDNARRAVLAGLEIAARTTTAAPGFELSAGVHTGPAVILSRGSGEHLALGETLDLAMALQEQAEPGKVWMSGATHSLVAGFFNDHEVDSAGGVAAFRVNAARDVHDRVEASESLTPFIGRQHELALLDSRWELASEGVGQAVMISGDVGIGKSRLLCELQARWSSADRRWLSAYGSPFARNLPLHPVGGLLRHLLEIDGSAATERQLVRLEAALAEHNLPPEETLSLFAALLGLPADDELDLYRLRREALEAVPALLQESAARHPLVLAFEDLHHADPTTLELIGRVIESVAASSALLVMTCRAGFRLPWGHRAQMTQLRLVPFDDAEVEALIDSLANEDRLAVDARKRLAERADGVPLFVEALVEQALDAEPSGAETVPETVRDLLEVQLDRVGAARDVARIAAGLGRQGRLADLAKAAALDKAALSQELERLREA
ncbi:MAG: AAA family ATPase, partial [Acidobacteriota bacterium]